MKVQNTTSQNRSKQLRLASERTLPRHHLDTPRLVNFLESLDSSTASKDELLYSIGTALVAGNQNPAVQAFLCEYDYPLADIPAVPPHAFDILGSVYQYLNTKAENLAKGSFFTGKDIGADVVADLDFSRGQTIFDPSCGSGSLLFRSSAPADQISGVDVDPLAVMIAKFNYFIKFPDAKPPALHCEDFFTWFLRHESVEFDYVVGNPPYGAEIDLSLAPSGHISSGESFSYFTECGFKLLKPDGKLRYLVPEALLNVKRHTDVRRFLLDHTNLKLVRRYRSKFTGVMSDVYLIELDRQQDCTHTTFIAESEVQVPKAVFRSLKNSILVQWCEADVAVIQKVNALKRFDLSGSTFALGVVTGDNKTRLFPGPRRGSEPIYTGKEVEKYALLPPKNHIFFDRANLQQVAPDKIYRAPEKLLYKVISKCLRFALDTNQSLSTNSANLVIPRIPGYDVASVMALLNSQLYSFLYRKLFGGVNKIGKEHLMALPFPEITFAQNSELVQLVKHTVTSGSDQELQDYIHESIFGLSHEEVTHIGRVTV